MFLGGHKVAKILYIAIYSLIYTMVKPYIHHGEDTELVGGLVSHVIKKIDFFGAGH